MDTQQNGYYLSAVFWGLWLLPLGYLAITSGYLPRPVGVLLIAGGVGYLVDLFIRFLAPALGAHTGPDLIAIGAVAEGLLMLWLLIKGVRIPPTSPPAAPVVAERLVGGRRRRTT
jgi:hypothetical protein